MKHSVKRLWTTWALTGGICIIAGVLLICFPTGAINAVCYLFGGALFVMGAGQMLYYTLNLLNKDAYQYVRGYSLVTGVAMAGAGIFCFFGTEFLASIIPVFLGLVILVSAVSKLQQALDLNKLGYSGWFPLLITALGCLAFGALVLFNPFSSAKVLIICIGVGLVISGCTDLVSNICLNKRLKEVKDLFSDHS